ncbi:MAG TPA: hypothetical protein DD740_00685, partial [Chryseobacterium sp.]|nr:hypothetical protein [Chryseobacterium sp.]
IENQQVNQKNQKILNTKSRKKNLPTMTSSGIGVDNLKQRLNLLYPDKHEFHSCQNDGMCIAEVKLKTK